MSVLVENYRAVNEGRMAKAEFLRQARQSLPGYINQFTSYGDAIKIFKNKGILTEEVDYVCPGDKFSLEAIERGIRCELEDAGIYDPTEAGSGDYKKAKKAAIDNLCKDPLYYLKRSACCCDKCKTTQADAEAKKGVNYKQKKTEGEMKEVKPGQKKVSLNEIWGSDDDAARDDWYSKEISYLKPFVEWAKANVGTRTREDKSPSQFFPVKDNPESGLIHDEETIDGNKYSWNERGDNSNGWDNWQLYVQSGVREMNISPSTHSADVVSFREWNSLFDNLYKDGSNLSEAQEEDDIHSRVTSKYQEKKATFTEKDSVVAQLTQALMKKVNPETKKNYTQKEARAKALKMFKDKEKSKVNEAVAAGSRNEGDKVFRDMWVKYMSKEYFEKVKANNPEAKKMSPVEAADKALAFVRNNLGTKGFIPSRDTLNSMSGPHWKMEILRRNGDISFNQNFSMKESKVLKEAIEKSIVRVLSEAATANLAKLSDENASIQGIPAILNNLENIVTEVESFIIKEQAKIQSIFDTIGGIKNEDNIPIGYKFVEPIMNSFKADLEPVLQKVTLDDIKVPEAPEPDQTEMTTGEDQPTGPGTDPIMSQEDKASMFAPKGAKPNPLAESKVKRGRYTILK